MKTLIATVILLASIGNASAGGFKIEKPCGTRGAEPCIVLAQKQTYPSDLRYYEMYPARRSLTPAPSDDVSRTTIVTTYSFQTSRR